MVIAIIGESCVGKSTLADKIKDELKAEVFSGKDYLRLSKNQAEAERLFKEKLFIALSGDNIIYVISEKEHIALLPDGAFKILVKADLDTIKRRFKERMHGVLPPPVERMLETKHGCFDNVSCDLVYDGETGETDRLIETVKERIK